MPRGRELPPRYPMANSGADTRRERGAPSTQPTRPPSIAGPQAPLGPTLALTVALAIGLFVVLLGLVLILTSPTPLPPPLGEQEQDVETALYVAVFALILPAALIAVPRLADAIAAGPNAGALSLLVAFLVATLAVAILVVRVLPGGGGVVEALSVVGTWWLGAVALLARAARGALRGRGCSGSPTWHPSLGRWRAPSSSARSWPSPLWGRSAWFRSRWAPLPSPPSCSCTRAAAPACHPCRAAGDGDRRRGHRPLPAGDSRPGHLRLRLSLRGVHQSRDPVSPRLLPGAGQRGARTAAPCWSTRPPSTGSAPIYFLAAGSSSPRSDTGPSDSSTGSCSRSSSPRATACCGSPALPGCLPAGALALAVIALIYNLEYSVGSLPQHGPLRFGLPMLVILAAVAEARWPRPLARRRSPPSSSSSASPRSGRSRPSPTRSPRSQRSPAFGPGRSRGRDAWHGSLRQGPSPGGLRGRPPPLRRRDAGLRRRSCPIGASTSPTWTSSCSATSATSPTTSPTGRRACPWARRTWPRRPRSSCWSAAAATSSSGSGPR